MGVTGGVFPCELPLKHPVERSFPEVGYQGWTAHDACVEGAMAKDRSKRCVAWIEARQAASWTSLSGDV